MPESSDLRLFKYSLSSLLYDELSCKGPFHSLFFWFFLLVLLIWAYVFICCECSRARMAASRPMRQTLYYLNPGSCRRPFPFSFCELRRAEAQRLPRAFGQEDLMLLKLLPSLKERPGICSVSRSGLAVPLQKGSAGGRGGAPRNAWRVKGRRRAREALRKCGQFRKIRPPCMAVLD